MIVEVLSLDVPYQTSVIFSSYCHHPAVIGILLMADPFYTDVDDFFKITEGLPLQNKLINKKQNKTYTHTIIDFQRAIITAELKDKLI